MLMPDKSGHFVCQADNCEFKSCNLFDFFDHLGVDMRWKVSLSKDYSFDLFLFLQMLDDYLRDGDVVEVHENIQSAVLLLANASGDDFEEFINESIVIDGMSTLMEDIEGFLKKHD